MQLGSSKGNGPGTRLSVNTWRKRREEEKERRVGKRKRNEIVF